MNTRRNSRVVFSALAVCTVMLAGMASCGGGGGASTTFTVGGTVSGLAGTLVLQNNGTDDLTITQDGPFTFATALADGSAYAVTVNTQPEGQTCSVSAGAGTISGADVTDVSVVCQDSVVTYTVGGTVSGLAGTLVLQNNGTDDLTITQDGPFTFATALADGSAYAVTVNTQPEGQTCSVSAGAGTISGADVTDVSIACKDSGTLDTSFGSTGFVVHHNAAGGSSDDLGNSITTDSQGRILVAGYSNNGSDNDMVIWRYREDGTLDTDFHSTGFVVHNNAAGGNGDDLGTSITTDSQGRILVAGYSYNGSDNDMVIWRYREDGTLDTDFHSTGFVVHNNAAGGNGDDFGHSISIDSQGRILVAGISHNGSDPDMVIWRYREDGILDTTFNSTGFVVHHGAAGGNFVDHGLSITTDSQGRILVSGASHNGSNLDMAIWRYREDGTLDTSFNSTGFVVHHNAAGGSSDDLGNSITTDSQGRILVAGYSNNGSDDDMVIWRYREDGTLDTSFNSTGYVVHHNAAGGDGDEYCRAITIDSQGRILVAGYSLYATGNYDMVIWRYREDGTLDTSFNSFGYVVHHNAAGGNSSDFGRSITTDSQGRILVSGASINGSSLDMVIWRYIQ